MARDELPVSPAEVPKLSATGADRLLAALETTVPERPPCVELPTRLQGPAFVFGDTHGDWLSTMEVVHAFQEAGPSSVLVGLGDYVDRAPSDLPFGCVANALFLLGLAARFPDRVYLLQGNHETSRRIGAVPHTLPEEVELLWGPTADRYDRLMGLLERGPLAATAPSGAYFAHAGFPRGPLPSPWHQALARPDAERLLELVWAEPSSSHVRRGAIPPWTERDLNGFLEAAGLTTFWRGHDPDLSGRAEFHGRVMTLHTSRLYQRYGGVLMAVVPLDHHLTSVAEAELRHLSTETVPIRR